MSPKLIILVENDVNLRHSIALLLQRAGYLVTATDGVNEALDLIQTRRYHLLISDVNIPETRKVLIPRVTEVNPKLPIVLLTDQSSVEVERERHQSHANYLVKPVAPERLLDSVQTMVGRSNNTHHSNHLETEGHI